ncbi:MAG: hypothetical protein HY741_11560 [Chloroflexi bacterium]|nr:hypothetical protein [Chloroflexota bacterium]
MVRKAAWMLVLLVALLVISASAAWAAGVNRSAQSSLSSSGNAAVAKLDGTGGTRYVMPRDKLDSHGHCFMGEDAAAAEAAY